MNFKKILNLLRFHEGYDFDDFNEKVPRVTTGSIIWGTMLRVLIVIPLCFWFVAQVSFLNYWYLMIFSVWLFVAFPAYKMYEHYQVKAEKFQEETLCGSCTHFESQSRMCKIYDEHVSKDYIPCEGLEWEPKRVEI